MSHVNRYDVVLIGGGITGLLACFKLSRLGMKVLLIEKESMLASGPSTRNEGWLHRGTYHAGSIKDRGAAIQVARRCIYGHEQIRALAPECIDDVEQKSFALMRDHDHIDDLVSRWDEAGVQYKLSSRSEVAKFFPDAELSRVSAVFSVADISINTRLLYRHLYASALRNGAEIRVGASISEFDGMSACIRTDRSAPLHVQAEVFIHAAGFGVRDIFRSFFGIELPIRYWKSHLVVAPRLGEAGLFFIDAYEAAMMHHGDRSIIGLNEDAVLCEEPTYDVVSEKLANLHAALSRLVPSWNGRGHLNIACTKVDLAPIGAARSLNVAIREPVDGHICVLPGKMTEAPYVTDVLLKIVHDRLDTNLIAQRPCDRFEPLPREIVHAA